MTETITIPKAEYERLLRENEALRGESNRLAQRRTQLVLENERLAAEVAVWKQRLARVLRCQTIQEAIGSCRYCCRNRNRRRRCREFTNDVEREKREVCGVFERCLGILDRGGGLRGCGGRAEGDHAVGGTTLDHAGASDLVYMYKHIAALLNHLQRGKLNSESVIERLMDIANYCALMYVVSDLSDLDHCSNTLHARDYNSDSKE